MQRKVLAWIRGGLVAAAWLAPECRSFTRARDRGGGDSRWPPPVRSDAEPYGFPDLSVADQVKVANGNATAIFAARVYLLCHRLLIPCAIENPQRSRMWLLPEFVRIAQLRGSKEFTSDCCAFGRPWRKRAKWLACWLDLSAAAITCSGRRICQFRGVPHQTLEGRDSNNILWTQVAQPYPPRMCTAICRCFRSALVKRTGLAVSSLFAGLAQESDAE